MFKKIAQGCLKVVEAICVFLLGMILLCMCIQIGCRILSISQSFTEELAKLCFSAMIFIGAPLMLAEGADISVDMVVNMLPAPARRVVDVLGNVILALFSVLAIRSFVTFIEVNQGVTAVSMTFIQMNWLYYVFLVSFALLFVVSVAKAVAGILGKPQTIDINAAAKKAAAEAEKELDLGI